jgi:hypothetical protein
VARRELRGRASCRRGSGGRRIAQQPDIWNLDRLSMGGVLSSVQETASKKQSDGHGTVKALHHVLVHDSCSCRLLLPTPPQTASIKKEKCVLMRRSAGAGSRAPFGGAVVVHQRVRGPAAAAGAAGPGRAGAGGSTAQHRCTARRPALPAPPRAALVAVAKRLLRA